MSWSGVITDAGRELIDQWEVGGHVLTIDKATVGDGNTAAESMREATALDNEIEDATIVRKDAVGAGSRFQIQILATSNSAYTAKEIGLWGHLDDDDTSTLIALHQDETGIYVPTVSEMPDFAFVLFLFHAISNNDSLEVNVDASALVTVSDFQDAIDDCVHLSEQELSDSQKNQVRTNFGIPTSNALADLTYAVEKTF